MQTYIVSFAFGGLGPDREPEGSNACPGITTSPTVAQILATIRSVSVVTRTFVFRLGSVSWVRSVSGSLGSSVGGAGGGVPLFAAVNALAAGREGFDVRSARSGAADGASLSKITVRSSPLSLSSAVGLLLAIISFVVVRWGACAAFPSSLVSPVSSPRALRVNCSARPRDDPARECRGAARAGISPGSGLARGDISPMSICSSVRRSSVKCSVRAAAPGVFQNVSSCSSGGVIGRRTGTGFSLGPSLGCARCFRCCNACF